MLWGEVMHLKEDYNIKHYLEKDELELLNSDSPSAFAFLSSMDDGRSLSHNTLLIASAPVATSMHIHLARPGPAGLTFSQPSIHSGVYTSALVHAFHAPLIPLATYCRGSSSYSRIFS